MKTKQFFLMAAALCASAVFTACSSELAESVQTVAEPQDGYPISISATKAGSDDITRALALQNEGEETEALTTSWSAGEKVYVYKNDAGEKVAELTPTSIDASDPKKCTLTGVITGTYTTSDKLYLYYLKEKDAGYSGQLGTIADIAANFDLCKAVVDITSVAPNGTLLAWGDATFQRQQSITKFSFKLGDSYSAMVKPLKISATGLTGGTTTESPLTIQPAVATDKIFVALQNTSGAEQTYTFVGNVGGLDWTGTKKANLENNKYYLATVNLYRDLSSVSGIVITANPVKKDESLDGSNITVTDNGNVLTLDTDYSVAYKKGDDSKTTADATGDDYTATITGLDKYKGTKTSEAFSVTELPTPVITLTTGDVYVADGQIIAQNATGWQIAATATYGPSSTSVDADKIHITSSAAGLGIAGGNITATTPGTYTITITVDAVDGTHNAATKVITVYVQQSGMGGELPGTTTENSSWTNE